MKKWIKRLGESEIPLPSAYISYSGIIENKGKC